MRTFAPVSDTRGRTGGRACHSQARRSSEEVQSWPQCSARVTPQHRWHSGARVSLGGTRVTNRRGGRECGAAHQPSNSVPSSSAVAATPIALACSAVVP